MKSGTAKGVAYAVLAYCSWGFLPLYWKALGNCAPLSILSHRILWASIFTTVIVILSRRGGFASAFRDLATALTVAACGVLIGLNWFIYIWAVNSGHTIDASLGYYINPLFSIALGLVFFRERLVPLQWAAIALAAAGVGSMAATYGKFPIVAVSLMATFGLYGLLKKIVRLDPLLSLACETLFLAPFALAYMATGSASGTEPLFFSDARTVAFLLLAGPITAFPLWWFALGAKSIPLSSMGFLQFLSPTLQLLVGIFVFGEPFGSGRLFNFGLVWAGLLLYALSYLSPFRGKISVGPAKTGTLVEDVE